MSLKSITLTLIEPPLLALWLRLLLTEMRVGPHGAGVQQSMTCCLNDSVVYELAQDSQIESFC